MGLSSPLCLYQKVPCFGEMPRDEFRCCWMRNVWTDHWIDVFAIDAKRKGGSFLAEFSCLVDGLKVQCDDYPEWSWWSIGHPPCTWVRLMPKVCVRLIPSVGSQLCLSPWQLLYRNHSYTLPHIRYLQEKVYGGYLLVWSCKLLLSCLISHMKLVPPPIRPHTRTTHKIKVVLFFMEDIYSFVPVMYSSLIY